MSHRVVFMGTPDFAVPSLRAMLETQTVVGVFTQPDRPAGRGRRLQASPVKRLAEAQGIPVFQPRSLRREPESIEALAALRPDAVAVAAYGLILPEALLAIAPGRVLNVHASLLPRWRGAAPINYAILAGDTQTGVTIMQVEAGLDTGPMLARQAIPLPPDATAGRLSEQLAGIGAELLARTLPEWLAGRISPEPQDEARASYAPRLARADGRLDWREAAEALERRVRAMDPWPGAFFDWEDLAIKVLAATVVGRGGGAAESADFGPPATAGVTPAASSPATAFDPTAVPAATKGPVDPPPPGTARLDTEGRPLVATGRGWLRLDRLQAPGRGPSDGAAFARGRPHWGAAPLPLPAARVLA